MLWGSLILRPPARLALSGAEVKLEVSGSLLLGVRAIERGLRLTAREAGMNDQIKSHLVALQQQVEWSQF